jgi:U3 small nucleolar RNA-associated protein 13
MKISFKKDYTIQTLLTGRTAAVAGASLLLTNDDQLTVLNIHENTTNFIQMNTQISTFNISKSHIAVALNNLSLQLYEWTDTELPFTLTLLKSFKPHEAPVLAIAFEKTSSLFATGSADTTVKVWSVREGHCTHNFKGHGGIISALQFHPHSLLLASGSDDSKVRLWDLNSKNCVYVIDSHVAVITDLKFTSCGSFLFTCSRDQVFCKWDLERNENVLTVPVYEQLECIDLIMYNGCEVVLTAGSKGLLKLWDQTSGEPVYEQESITKKHGLNLDLITNDANDQEHNPKHEIVNVIVDENIGLITISSDQNIQFYEEGLVMGKQFAGYNEEILCICNVIDDNHIGVVSNSEQIRIYDLTTMNCTILNGHDEIVLCVASSFDKSLMISGSKDNSAIIWTINDKSSILQSVQLKGHTSSVSSVCFSKHANTFAITASHDRTIKLWDLKSILAPKSRYTILAHEKDVLLF